MDMFKRQKLCTPGLDHVADILGNGLQDMFSDVCVKVMECPNLKEKEFMLAAEGLCGSPALAYVGGFPYLVPLAKKEKVYNLKEIARRMDTPDAFIIGAVAAPVAHVGVNCEMMANVKFGKDEMNNSYIAKLGKEDECLLIPLKDSTDFCILGNLFVSEGKPGKVIKVTAKQRKSPGNFVSCMRKALADHFQKDPVGIGGVFVIKSGKAKVHLMPDFPETPINTGDDFKNWLKFFNMSPPLICLSSFISCDPGMNMRLEHTHCFSDHGEGGHYHEDTEPEIVEYEGYFNVAEYIYRFDEPTETHDVLLHN